jgi:hypothetical protein
VGVTSFLIGEYADAEQRHPVFTIADTILWLPRMSIETPPRESCAP